MTNTLKYKGYEGSVEPILETGMLYGKILFVEDLVTYTADTLAKLKFEFEAAVDDYLETCEQIGKKPEKPFNGQFNVRTTKAIHKELAKLAVRENKNFNRVVCDALERHVNKPSVDADAHTHNHTYLNITLDASNLTDMRTVFSVSSNQKTIGADYVQH